MSLKDALDAILLAGWIRIRPLIDPVYRDRTSAAGNAAALTVRQLAMLRGNWAVQAMVESGLRPLLILLSSPTWLDSHISQRSLRATRRVRDRDQWAMPVGLEGGQDKSLRGIPGGDAHTAINLFLRAGGATDRPASAAVRRRQAWIDHAKASRAFERPASIMVGSIEAMVLAGDQLPDRRAAEAAVRQEFAAELAWLETRDGAIAIAGRTLEYPRIEVPAIDVQGMARALQGIEQRRREALEDVIDVRPGIRIPTTRPGGWSGPLRVQPDGPEYVVVDDSIGDVRVVVPDLTGRPVDQAPVDLGTGASNRNEGQAAQEGEGSPAKKKIGRGTVVAGLGLAAGLGLVAWKWRR